MPLRITMRLAPPRATLSGGERSIGEQCPVPSAAQATREGAVADHSAYCERPFVTLPLAIR
jgi:hypothetical protein